MSNNKTFEISNNYSRKDTTQVEELDNIFKTKDNVDIKNSKSNRSKLLNFYCYGCNCVHEDYHIKDIVFIGEEMYMCRESFEKAIGLK